MISFAVILLTISSALVAGDSSQCPSQANSGYLYVHNNKCYQFILDEKTWLDAQRFCYSRGAALANAETSSIHNWLVSTITHTLRGIHNKQGFWLGLHDRNIENTWEWDAGPGQPDTRMSWSNWQPGEPNDITRQDCVYMRRSYGWKWVDVGCGDGWHVNRHYTFACEYKLPTTTTTTTTTTTPKPTTTTTPRPTTTTATTPRPTTTTTTPRPTTTTTTPRPTTTTTTTSSTLLPLTNSTSTTTTKPVPPPNVGNNVDGTSFATGQTANKQGLGGSAKTGNSKQNDEDKTGLLTGIIIGLLSLIAVLAVLIILVRRRKQYGEAEPTNTLENPCYVETGGQAVVMFREENPYDTCQDLGPNTNGNVYVEVGNTAVTADGSGGKREMAFSNQKYMQTRALWSDECVENLANSQKAAGKCETEKYLDECGAYTEDGYMQQKHLYADISDIPLKVPAVPSHYDVPEPISPPANSNVYDEPKNLQVSPAGYANVPQNNYDTPRLSSAVAAEYANGEARPQSSDGVQGAHYDVPKPTGEIVDNVCTV